MSTYPLMNLPFSLRESGADFLYVTAPKRRNGSRVTTAFLSRNIRSSQTAYCYTYQRAARLCRPKITPAIAVWHALSDAEKTSTDGKSQSIRKKRIPHKRICAFSRRYTAYPCTEPSPKLTASASSTCRMAFSSSDPIFSRRRRLSSVRICSVRMMESLVSP